MLSRAKRRVSPDLRISSAAQLLPKSTRHAAARAHRVAVLKRRIQAGATIPARAGNICSYDGAVRPAILFAPGAGAPSSSAWMQRYAAHLGHLGAVTAFDYPYMREGRKSPDRWPTLLQAHRDALAEVRSTTSGPVVLAGKSMGSRVGCHLSDTEEVAALVCFGYPLRGARADAPLRDGVLRTLRTPVLFVQGTRDKLCPLDLLEDVRRAMTAPNALHVVETGDHSLEVTRTYLKTHGCTQDDVERGIMTAVAEFLARHVPGLSPS